MFIQLELTRLCKRNLENKIQHIISR
uniref:Uncharacterized protein n=1 Tax=Rhizophora mucronata TaxID=61149 RepID=A0A2P2Q5I9_RHIMU